MEKDVRVGEAKTAENTPHTRRDFVRAAGQVAVTSPAVSLLLAGMAMPAAALPFYNVCGNSSVRGGACQFPLDDFTFGNNEEDIDALALGSNFNPFNGGPQLDDVVP